MHRVLIPLILSSMLPAAFAGEVPVAATSSMFAAYAKPAELVDIGARTLNLRCSGSGSPTVVLEAGANADSLAWAAVQPLIAQNTKVCSYDRAGYGFSGEGPQPRDVDSHGHHSLTWVTQLLILDT